MNKNTRDILNKVNTTIIKPRRTGLTYSAYDAVKEYMLGTDSTTVGEQAKEKSPTIEFDLLSLEARLKAEDKIAAFDNIIPGTPDKDQKQEDYIESKQAAGKFSSWEEDLKKMVGYYAKSNLLSEADSPNSKQPFWGTTNFLEGIK